MAGLRTNALVALGAAAFVIFSQLFPDEVSPTRVAAQVVSGIGFLGAGTILKGNKLDTHQVKGLTTAAGLWMTAAIGVAAGMGREATALLSTLLALGVLSLMPWIIKRLEREEQGGDA